MVWIFFFHSDQIKPSIRLSTCIETGVHVERATLPKDYRSSLRYYLKEMILHPFLRPFSLWQSGNGIKVKVSMQQQEGVHEPSSQSVNCFIKKKQHKNLFDSIIGAYVLWKKNFTGYFLSSCTIFIVFTILKCISIIFINRTVLISL